MRGATLGSALKSTALPFQSTRPMRGATAFAIFDYLYSTVSIHAPHAGRDCDECSPRLIEIVFQSTRPMRGATADIYTDHFLTCVSIHAPHAGRDNGG